MSCLFNSLGQLLGYSGNQIRSTLVDYMQSNLNKMYQGMSIRDWIKWQEGGPENASVEDYLNSMRHASTWGGAMELAMAAQCYRLDIVVVRPTSYVNLNRSNGDVVAEFLWRDATTARRRLILEWTGNHYEPLRSLDLLHFSAK